MDWPIVLALVLAIPLILFSAVLGWSINVMGIRDIVAERRLELIEVIHGRRLPLDFIIPPAIVGLAIYGFLIWFLLDRFGWWAALAIGLGLPIVFGVPILVWVLTISGLASIFRKRIPTKTV
jgi:hypothetical protein